MMPRGFKPVGWVAAVGGAALGCYMLSLNVAAERAELAKIEREIVLAKQEIRSLQTELGTRGRLQQLEHWNAEVLALSAPASGQFLEDAVTLARFERPEKTFEEKAKVQLASADVAKPAAPRVEPRPEIGPARKLPPVQFAVATERALPPALLRQASYTPGEVRTLAAAVVRPEAKPLLAKASPKAEPKKAEPKAAEPKTPQAKAEPKKSASLKAVVASLDDDKPAEAPVGGKSKMEAGLR